MKLYIKYFFAFVFLQALALPVFAANGDDISTVVSKSGSYQSAPGYYNSHTSDFVLTVTINDPDYTTYTTGGNGEVKAYVVFNDGAATAINDEGWEDLDAQSLTYTVSAANLALTTGWPGDGGTVDFQLRVRDVDGGNNIYDAVTFADGSSELTIDRTFNNWGVIEPVLTEDKIEKL